jgi:Tol biopolymer transport system component
LVVLSLLLILGLSGLSGAALTVIPIEGRLVVSASGDPSSIVYYMTGFSDNIVPVTAGVGGIGASLSPIGEQCVYYNIVAGCGGPGPRPCTNLQIFRVNLDGSGDTSLTPTVGGLNCKPRWSPDGSMIAFDHCDPVPGEYPCNLGWRPWVMNADGTDAHEVAPGELAWANILDWTPDGYRLLLRTDAVPGYIFATIDIDGTDLQGLAVWGTDASYSPDGARIAFTRRWEDTVDGTPGYSVGLLTANADGSDPQVLYAHFVSAADVEEYLSNFSGVYADLGGFLYWFGPAMPEWSPNGDRIAFVAMIPFHPDPQWAGKQDEVWICDVATGELTKITENQSDEFSLNWTGNNTSPSHPTVTVNNTTVAFSSVTGDGFTTIIRNDDPPAMPTGYQFCGEHYEINTTAPHSGVITITMTYKDEDVPGGNEGALALLHYKETTQQWEDITTFRDPVANILRGETESLSLFGLGLRLPIWVSPLQNGTTEAAPAGPFKRGRTIPVKFRLHATSGQLLSDAEAELLKPQLQVFYEKPGSPGITVDPGDIVPDGGGEFRYEGHMFIYNLSTKDPAWVANYTYGLDVLINGAKAGEVFFSLR